MTVVPMLVAMTVPIIPVSALIPEVRLFAPIAAECAGAPVDRGGIVRPVPVVAFRHAVAGAPNAAPEDHVLIFDIDADGRTRSIRDAARQSTIFDTDGSDLAPALAVSRFPAGAARRGCVVTYRVAAVPVDTAPLPLLQELASRPGPGFGMAAVMDRIRPADADCPRGPGPYRRLNQPAFETIPQAPGTTGWTLLAYDVDPAGRPKAVRVLGSSGNAVLDRAGVAAVAANRYAPGPGMRGCIHHFYRVARSEAEAPALPPETPPDTGDVAACRIDPRTIRYLSTGAAYPRAFARRGIEGIAVIGYDVAPWGGIGNVQVIAAEPAEAFGTVAKGAIGGARAPESAAGHRGCVRRVRFALPPEPATATD